MNGKMKNLIIIKLNWNQAKNLSSIRVFLEIFLFITKSAMFFIIILHITIVIKQAMTTLFVAM